ncbi:MAG: hypothetical protein R3B68_07015 [Phycisphaerales bacterium]
MDARRRSIWRLVVAALIGLIAVPGGAWLPVRVWTMHASPVDAAVWTAVVVMSVAGVAWSVVLQARRLIAARP